MIKDAILAKILKLLESGKNLTSYKYKAPEDNYMIAASCLLFEHRFVVPVTLQ